LQPTMMRVGSRKGTGESNEGAIVGGGRGLHIGTEKAGASTLEEVPHGELSGAGADEYPPEGLLATSAQRATNQMR